MSLISRCVMGISIGIGVEDNYSKKKKDKKGEIKSNNKDINDKLVNEDEINISDNNSSDNESSYDITNINTLDKDTEENKHIDFDNIYEKILNLLSFYMPGFV